MIDYIDCGVVWYAMKTTYKKELQAKRYLESRGIKCFVPMIGCDFVKAGRKTTVLKPAMHNLIFVQADINLLADIKISLNYLHNRLTRSNGKLQPIIVPTLQMNQFVDAVNHQLENITYVDLSVTQLDKGVPVRITDGMFKGYEGELERIKGKRDKRVCVNVNGIVAYKFDVEANYVVKI